MFSYIEELFDFEELSNTEKEKLKKLVAKPEVP